MEANRERRIEVLAPAGSFASLKAGIRAGADAVYVGGTKFGARAYADNFKKDELLEAIDYVHLRRKKIYLTVNTLLTNEEVEHGLYSFLTPFYRQGIDAVIVQDVGALRFIHENFPNLDIHASTQMTLTMAEGAAALTRYGVRRMVPARELTLSEIRSMREKTDLQLEVFVHGALCYSYSGQCLMSAMLGGRSGNRGSCAGPCRLPYTHQGEQGYFLSLKDLCALGLIGGLVDAGVDSFKIEGRMKKPEYVALTTHLYRKYTDYCMELGTKEYERWLAGGPKEYGEDVKKLMDVYNRGGFTRGYLQINHSGEGDRETMPSTKRPGHYGVYVGKVARMERSFAYVKLEEMVHAGDVLEFRDETGRSLYEYTVGKEGVNQGVAFTNTGRGSGVSVGDEVYRTKNKRLLDEIRAQLIKENRIGIHATFTAKINEPTRLRLREGDVEVEILGEVVKEAKKNPITIQEVTDQLNRTGNTPFVCDALDVELDEGAFIPFSSLNILRRRAIEELERKILLRTSRKEAGKGVPSKRKTPSLSDNGSRDKRNKKSFQGLAVSVCTWDQYKAVTGSPMVRRIYLSTEELGLTAVRERLKEDGGECYLTLPYVLREEAYGNYKKWWNDVKEEVWPCIAGFVIRNFEGRHFVGTVADPRHEKEWVLNYNMYVENREAYRFWSENGIDRVTVIWGFHDRDGYGKDKDKGGTFRDSWRMEEPLAGETLLYGYVPYMVSANCLVRNREGCIKRKKIQILTDEKKRKFSVVNECDSCYNIVYGEKPVSLISNGEIQESIGIYGLRLDFTMETKEEVERILRLFEKQAHIAENEEAAWKTY